MTTYDVALYTSCLSDALKGHSDKDRLSLQAEFDVLSTKEVEELLFKAKYSYYESGDKVTKLLAHQLRQASSSQQILTNSYAFWHHNQS